MHKGLIGFLVIIIIILAPGLHGQSDPFDHQEIFTNISTYNGQTEYFKNDLIKINYLIRSTGGACGDWRRDKQHAYLIKVPKNFSIDDGSISVTRNNIMLPNAYMIEDNNLYIYFECTKENRESITDISYAMRCRSDRLCPKNICLSDYISYGTNLDGYFKNNNISISLSNSPPFISDFVEKNEKDAASSDDNLIFTFAFSDNDSSYLLRSLCINGSIIRRFNVTNFIETGTLIHDIISINASELGLGQKRIQAYISDGEDSQLSFPPLNITVTNNSSETNATKKTSDGKEGWIEYSTYITLLNIALLVIINGIILKEVFNKAKNLRSHLRCISAYNTCLVIFAILLIQDTNSILNMSKDFLTRLTALGILATICFAEHKFIDNDTDILKNKNNFLVGGLIFLLLLGLLAPYDLIFCTSIVCIIQLYVPIIAYNHISK